HGPPDRRLRLRPDRRAVHRPSRRDHLRPPGRAGLRRAVRARLVERVALPTVGSLVLVAVLVGGGLLYASSGPGSRDILVTQMLVNAIIVLGLQVFIGNTGILSFGHMGFATVAG